MKERHDHWCGCHFQEGSVLSQRREKAPLYPQALRWVLPMSRHIHGPHCISPDPSTPVRLDWRQPDRYDRTPVRQPCGHVVGPGIAHACGPRPGRLVLFGGRL